MSKGRGVKKGPVNFPDLNSGDVRDIAAEKAPFSGKTMERMEGVLKIQDALILIAEMRMDEEGGGI